MRIFWKGTVNSITEWKDNPPEVTLHLGGWVDLGWYAEKPIIDSPALPRTGQEYWLIDDETFEKVKDHL